MGLSILLIVVGRRLGTWRQYEIDDVVTRVVGPQRELSVEFRHPQHGRQLELTGTVYITSGAVGNPLYAPRGPQPDYLAVQQIGLSGRVLDRLVLDSSVGGRPGERMRCGVA